MNFLAHDYILPAGVLPLTRVGSALPDLWPLLPQRILPMVALRRLRASARPQARPLALGIRSHMMADAVFHGHPEFLRRVEWMAPQLTQAWPGLRHASLASHVLVEMQLDRWLLRREPERVDDYYACFTSDAVDGAARMTAHDEESFWALRELLERFTTSGFLRDYADVEGLAGRFLRTLLRTPLASRSAPSLAALSTLVRATTEPLSEGSEQLLADVRAGAERRAAEP